jgi:hypothetical protein
MVRFGLLKRKLAYGVAFALLVALTPAAYAAPTFSYSDSASTTITNAGGSITITGLPGSFSVGTSNQPILSVSINGSGSSSILFSQSVSFPLTIDGVIISFSGVFSGSLGDSSTSASLTAISPPSPITFSNGGYDFSVSYFPMNFVNGSETYNVNVTATPIVPVPEPASLTLWGAVGLVGAWYGRRKLQRKVAL